MITSLLTSVGLGIGAGINAYATLLVFGLLARWQPGVFHDELARFFASTPVLIVVGVLYCIEFIAGSVALGAHATKATIRGASTLGTAGVANPILSLFEDVFAFAAAIIAMVLPWLVLAVIAAVTLFFITLWRRVRARSEERR